MSSIQDIIMGNRSFFAVISSRDVVTVKEVQSRHKSKQFMGTMKECEVRHIIAEGLAFINSAISDYVWITDKNAKVQDHTVRKGRLLLILSTEPIIATRIRGEDDSVLIVAQMSMEGIVEAGNVCGLQLPISKLQSGCFRLAHKNSTGP
jgi:hypothetical protein